MNGPGCYDHAKHSSTRSPPQFFPWSSLDFFVEGVPYMPSTSALIFHFSKVQHVQYELEHFCSAITGGVVVIAVFDKNLQLTQKAFIPLLYTPHFGSDDCIICQ